jgi:hypothetical protein
VYRAQLLRAAVRQRPRLYQLLRAAGIDVPLINNVINYGFPATPKVGAVLAQAA